MFSISTYLFGEEVKAMTSLEDMANESFEEIFELHASIDKVSTKTICNEIVMWAVGESKKKETNYIGVLLCEGDESSVDCAVYRIVFPDLLVVPVGGCATVVRMLPNLRVKLAPFKMYAFGMIDRDALSKKEIKKLLKTTGVNTTKLPFIENIICAPETLKFVCKYKGVEYEPVLQTVQAELMKTLWQRFKETLPINLGFEKNEKIIVLRLGASTKSHDISKEVDESNILYSYRDKVITSIIGTHVGIKGKKAYYSMILDMIKDDEYKDDLAKTFARFVPKLELYKFDDY